MSEKKSVSITVLLPAGRLPLELMAEVHRLAVRHDFRIYLSTVQNLRLTDVQQDVAEEVKARLSEAGAEFKEPGKFPIPRVCVGQGHCNLGLIDTEAMTHRIMERFGSRAKTKAKFKIAISACTMCCSGVKTSDIGIMATRDGFEVFAGGKGGPYPKIGRRIARRENERQVLEIIGQLVDFHDRKTENKQRFYKLLDESDFPFPEV